MQSLISRMAWAGALILSGQAQAQSPRPFQLEDLFAFDTVVEARISPRGDAVAVVTERRTQESYFGRTHALWIVPARGGEPKRIGTADGDRSRPAWSADSRMLAYMEKTAGRQALRLTSPGGATEPETLAVCPEGEDIAAYQWAPRGLQLAVICQKMRAPPPMEVPKIIVASQSALFHGVGSWSVGHTVALFDVQSHQRKELATGVEIIGADGALLWEPEGGALWLVVTKPDDPYAGMPFVSDRRLKRIEIATGRITQLPVELTNVGFPALAPDGNTLILPQGGRMSMSDWRQTWRLPPLRLRRLDARDGRELSAGTLDGIFLSRESQIDWRRAPGQTQGAVYFTWADRASQRIKAYYPSSGSWKDLTSADVSTPAFSVDAGGASMAIIRQSVNAPPDVYLLDLKHPSAPRRLTRFGEQVGSLYAVAPVESLHWRSADNRFDVHGWLLKPPGFDPRRRYPLIVDVHGGPGVLFQNDFASVHFEGGHEVPPELNSANGYMVLMVNPRGDPSYGRAYQEALLEGWEFPTRNDIFSGVDEVIRRGYADPQQLGIGGASYGGWVTAFAVTQTDRFKAASANDPVIDTALSSAVAYRGERSTNYWMHAGFAGQQALDAPFPNPDPRKVATPILLRFGLMSEDPKTHPSQFFTSGLQYFTYLDAHCKPVEMILHTQEGHGVFDWQTLRDYIGRDMAWFDYYLRGKGTAPFDPAACRKRFGLDSATP